MKINRPVFCAVFGLVLIAAIPEIRSFDLPESMASIEIDASKVEGTISPMLYGQFVEVKFGGVKGGLFAELIRNRSFEVGLTETNLPALWEREPDDRDEDPAMSFRWDDSVSYPVSKKLDSETLNHSLRADVSQKDGQRRGISQGRIPVRDGIEYKGYMWLKTTGFDGYVCVALEADRTEGETYAAADFPVDSTQWKKYEFSLRPQRADPLAKFSILLYGKGRIWIDQVSLIPGDSVDGVRADVLEKIKALRPSFVRWPGGNLVQDYHWIWGVGPRDERTTWTNFSWGNEREPSDFGTDEFVQFCQHIHAEPSIVVNVEGRGATAEEAAAWVEYVNGPPDSKYGALRGANGHPKPYAVKYWEIGNEIYGDWVRGHTDAETYGRNYNRYHAAMQAIDPSIKFIAVGDNDLGWDRTVLQIAGKNIDYLAVHHYYGLHDMHGDPLNLMAHPLFYERFYAQMRQLLREVVPNRQIKLAINEWNSLLPVPREEPESLKAALYGARLMNVFERNGDLIAMSAIANLVNGHPGSLIQASRYAVYVTPLYLVNKLYSNHLGVQRLAAKVDSPLFDTSLEGKGVPYLDAVVSRSADGKQIFIKAVNTDNERWLTTRIAVTGVEIEPVGQIETINGSSIMVGNTFAHPDQVSINRSELKAGTVFTVKLPAHSVSVITIHTRS